MMESTAFRELYDAYYFDVWRFVRTLIADEANDDVDEIVQSVFVKIALKGDQFRNQSKLSTWIYAIARNTVIDFVRIAKRDSARRGPSLNGTETDNVYVGSIINEHQMLDLAVSQDPSINPEMAAITTEESLNVHKCLDQLPMNMKVVVTCRLLAGLTVAETAEVMSWSTAHVRVTYGRALRKFKVLWEKEQRLMRE